ncbi:MAG: amino acid ABC transporter ATP-binding/permease protein [Coriobacteriales bacterium]|jgi:ATP-binding cassette subfamily C protein
MKAAQKRRRSALSIMGRLIVLVKPLVPIMLLAIVFGVVGYLCAIFLTICASWLIVAGPASPVAAALSTTDSGGFIAVVAACYELFCGPGSAADADFVQASTGIAIALLVLMGLMRGVLHYFEQYCNHHIAFKILAIIRHKVFAKLRELCPARLEGRDRGDLVSLITSDIELLEVFYAHTISPICIAVIVSIVMVCFIWAQAPAAGTIALIAYLCVGAVVPAVIGRVSAQPGLEFRNAFGDMNAFVLDSLRGIDETIQYGDGTAHLKRLSDRSRQLSAKQAHLARFEASQRSVSNLLVVGFSLAVFIVMMHLYLLGTVGFVQVVLATVAMMGSFGPVLALSSLANNLAQTLACGDRVLDLLDETAEVPEIEDGKNVSFSGAAANDVRFGYDGQTVLDGYSIEIEKGKITGIHGPSGSGKSTLLKLLMRFWDVDSGSVSISDTDVRSINTKSLRDNESYVTQETDLFHDSIANNIAIGKPGASREEIVAAAKKASIDSFIRTLPQGYDTEVGELGDTLSGGQRQRIGIARAFLHDAPFMILDEPTSNLDSLNEGIILKALKEEMGERTAVIVSHRSSTLEVADVVYEMESTRKS